MWSNKIIIFFVTCEEVCQCKYMYSAWGAHLDIISYLIIVEVLVERDR